VASILTDTPLRGNEVGGARGKVKTRTLKTEGRGTRLSYDPVRGARGQIKFLDGSYTATKVAVQHPSRGDVSPHLPMP